MDAQSWERFYKVCTGLDVAIGFIDASYFGLPGSYPHKIYLHHDVVAKGVKNHQLEPAHFTVLEDTLLRGAILTDPRRPKHLNLYHYNQEPFRYWFMLAIKQCRITSAVYVTTFFRMRQKDVLRRIKKAKILRTHIETGA